MTDRPANTVDPKLLEILVCPLTKGRLEYDADRQELRLCFATHNEEKLTEGARILGRILSAGLANSEACEAVGRPIR